MAAEDGEKERLSPVLRIAALAATLLALAAVITPRVLSGSGAGDTPANAAGALGGASGTLPDPTIPATAPPTTAGPPASSTTSPTTTTTSTTAASTTTTTVPPATTTTLPFPAPAGPAQAQGAVELTLVGLSTGPGGPERGVYFAGGPATWHFQVANTGDEYLWGVFVYLEGHGPVPCGTLRLDVGEGTDCWAETIGWQGGDFAVAWATAWTSTHMVTARISHHIGPAAAE